MPHNDLIHGDTAGAWSGITPSPADFALLDQRQFQAINGDLGGTWAPSALIILGGVGIQFTGDAFDVQSPAAFHIGLTVVGGDFEVGAGGAAIFTGPVTIDGVTIINGVLTVDGGATFIHGIAADGDSLFTANVTIDGTLHATTGLTTLSGGLTVDAGVVNLNTTTQIGGIFNISAVTQIIGSGHIRERVCVGTGGGDGTVAGNLDADTTIGPGVGVTISADIILISNALSANHIYTLGTGVAGQKILVSFRPCPIASFTVQIRTPGGTPLITIQKGGGTTHPYEAALLVATAGGGWQVALTWPNSSVFFG